MFLYPTPLIAPWVNSKLEIECTVSCTRAGNDPSVSQALLAVSIRLQQRTSESPRRMHHESQDASPVHSDGLWAYNDHRIDEQQPRLQLDEHMYPSQEHGTSAHHRRQLLDAFSEQLPDLPGRDRSRQHPTPHQQPMADGQQQRQPTSHDERVLEQPRQARFLEHQQPQPSMQQFPPRQQQFQQSQPQTSQQQEQQIPGQQQHPVFPQLQQLLFRRQQQEQQSQQSQQQTSQLQEQQIPGQQLLMVQQQQVYQQLLVWQQQQQEQQQRLQYQQSLPQQQQQVPAQRQPLQGHAPMQDALPSESGRAGTAAPLQLSTPFLWDDSKRALLSPWLGQRWSRKFFPDMIAAFVAPLPSVTMLQVEFTKLNKTFPKKKDSATQETPPLQLLDAGPGDVAEGAVAAEGEGEQHPAEPVNPPLNSLSAAFQLVPQQAAAQHLPQPADEPAVAPSHARRQAMQQESQEFYNDKNRACDMLLALSIKWSGARVLFSISSPFADQKLTHQDCRGGVFSHPAANKLLVKKVEELRKELEALALIELPGPEDEEGLMEAEAVLEKELLYNKSEHLCVPVLPYTCPSMFGVVAGSWFWNSGST